MKPSLFIPLLVLPGIGFAQELSLDSALKQARSNRPSVAAAEQRIVSAKLSRRALGAFPSARLFIGYSDPLEVGGSDDDLVVAQPLDVFGRTGAARSVGDAAVLRAEADYLKILSEIQFEVINQFAEASASRALAATGQAALVNAQKLRDAINTLVEEGKLPGVQLARVAIELERAKLMASQRDAQYRAHLRRLGGLLNVSPESISVQGFPELVVSTDEIDLVASRPDLLLIAAEVRAAEAEARVSGKRLLPELEIQGRQTAWQERDRQFGLRLQLSVPLFDYGRVRSETKAAQTTADAARKSLADAAKIAQSEVDAARIELEAAREQIVKFEEIANSTRALVEKSRIGFMERASTLIELLEATRALREVEEGSAEARLRLAKAKAEYLRASGQILAVVK